MAASRERISKWFDDGVKNKHRYMLVICDTFVWEVFPSYYTTEDSARRKMAHPGSMSLVMECYDLEADKEQQMNQSRCWALAP